MNILAFTFFVILSSIFWFSIAINKSYIDTITYPIKFENFPSQRIQVGELPQKMSFTVETSGKKILRHQIWSAIDPININLAECSLFPLSRKDSLRFYILTDIERQQIASQLPGDIRIMDIEPDTFLFHFDYLKSKKLPVIADIEINCEKQYMLVDHPVFEQDSLVISGPSSILDTLKVIRTKHTIFNNVDEPFDKNISIQEIEGLDFEKSKIRVMVDVDKFTEAKLTIPIIPINVPDSLSLKVFPSNMTISYYVTFKLFETVKAEDFFATINYSDIGLMNNEKLRISLERKPANIKVNSWTPKYVEYIIEK